MHINKAQATFFFMSKRIPAQFRHHLCKLSFASQNRYKEVSVLVSYIAWAGEMILYQAEKRDVFTTDSRPVPQLFFY